MLVLGVILNCNLLHDTLVLNPVSIFIRLASSLNCLLDVRFLALLRRLRLAVNQPNEVFCIEASADLLIERFDDVTKAVLLELTDDEFLADLLIGIKLSFCVTVRDLLDLASSSRTSNRLVLTLAVEDVALGERLHILVFASIALLKQ